jgi:hypothetical protein
VSSRRRTLATLGTVGLAATLTGPAVASAASSPTVTTVVSGLLSGLQRPTPKFVSGTKEGVSYSPKTHVYVTAYSTERPDSSGRYPANSVSGYNIPKSIYSAGYVASVRGGFVVSGSNDQLLLIASAKGATTVHLTVKPAPPALPE